MSKPYVPLLLYRTGVADDIATPTTKVLRGGCASQIVSGQVVLYSLAPFQLHVLDIKVRQYQS